MSNLSSSSGFSINCLTDCQQFLFFTCEYILCQVHQGSEHETITDSMPLPMPLNYVDTFFPIKTTCNMQHAVMQISKSR